MPLDQNLLLKKKVGNRPALGKPQRKYFLVDSPLRPPSAKCSKVWLQIKSFSLVDNPLPPPLSGLSTKKKFFAASPTLYPLFSQHKGEFSSFNKVLWPKTKYEYMGQYILGMVFRDEGNI